MEQVNCHLCQVPGEACFQKADKFPPHEVFTVVRCPTCGLQWVSPRPSLEEIARYYPETYSWKPATEGHESAVHRLERWYRFHLLRYETRQLLRHTDLKAGDAVLDVGCSSGDRLLVMKDAGLSPAGVELGPAADYARERLGLDVRRGTIDSFDFAQGKSAAFESGRFRAVTLYNVIEHVPDPRAVLREARRLLAPGGYLAVQCPNARSLQARLFGRRWAAMDVPRDLWYFTPELLSKLVREADLEPVTVVHRTSFLHPPTAAISLAPWSDPQRFWSAEASGGGLSPLMCRLAWAAITVAAMTGVWLESALGASAIPTLIARATK